MIRRRTNENCILCGSMNHTVVKRRLQHQERGVVLLCMSCGLAFLRDRMSEPDYKSYYREDYWSIYSDKSIPSPQNIEGQKARGTYIFSFIQEHLMSQSTAKLLEIGCGGGGILARIGELCDVKCCGIEPHYGFSKYAREEFGLDVRTGFLEDDLLEDDIFDYVILSHVLNNST